MTICIGLKNMQAQKEKNAVSALAKSEGTGSGLLDIIKTHVGGAMNGARSNQHRGAHEPGSEDEHGFEEEEEEEEEEEMYGNFVRKANDNLATASLNILSRGETFFAIVISSLIYLSVVDANRFILPPTILIITRKHLF